MTAPLKVGIVGCGIISGIYLRNCARFENLEVVACADRHLDRAEAKAGRYGVPRFCSVAELLADPEIDIVLNLTVPASHAEIAEAALLAGKSVYNEKPLAIERADVLRMLALAEEKGLMVGGAPDTFLGGGLQTCRKLIDEGAIGQPVAASAFIIHPRPETWHPSPDFFYQKGAGPLFDVGPYYLTALIALLGSVSRVISSARITFPERLITSQPRVGESITVRTPTHIAGVLDFESGVIANLVASFDVWAAEVPGIEIYGSEGTLSLPDPNTFGGPVRLRRAGDSGWTEVPISYGYTRNSRGIGLADMASALRSGDPARADGLLAYHVLDVMHSLLEASEQGKRLDLSSGVGRPAPMPNGMSDPCFIDGGANDLSIESKIGDLVASRSACAILESHLPGFTSNPQLQMMHGITLLDMADYDPNSFSVELIRAITADLGGMDAQDKES